MKRAILIVGLLVPVCVSAQSILGKVTNNKGEPLIGASVYWRGSTVGTTTGVRGDFELSAEGVNDLRLVASFVGHTSDTMSVSNETFLEITLNESVELSEVVVRDERDGVAISSLKPIKVEQISSVELAKAACCDLAGCFETQTTVQPQTTNVITNAKELRILGLSGVYNQVLIDGFPVIQGLTQTYGISGIPGTLVDNIYISKGANSVLQGYESISGQINVETIEPDKTDQLLLNAYMNQFLEKQVNANFAVKQGKWSNLTAFHMVQPANKFDRDKDGFLDLPLLTRYMVYNKWKYGKDRDWGWNSRIAVGYMNEQRVGGQVGFNEDTDKGSSDVYGQTVSIDQPSVWVKTGYRVNDEHNVVLHASAYYQNQNSYFGSVHYAAQQIAMYANLQHEFIYKAHVLKTGISFRHFNLEEDVSFTDTTVDRTYDGAYQRLENIPGAFAENTMKFFDNKLTWIAGVRGDYHNQFGFRVTPRTLLKYDVWPKTIVRASFGTGWRTVNLFSENIGLLVSSRDIVFQEQLQPERAMNFGANVTQKFETKDQNLSGYFSADYYRTQFQNQVFPDYDTDPTKALIGNFSGTSVGNGVQGEVSLKIWRRFEVKAGYNYLDVYRIVEGEKQQLPFNSTHKVVGAFSYRPLTKKFHFDMNVHWFGKQRLPDTKTNPEQFQRPDYSKPYTVVNAQFTYSFKMLDIYVGCENIFDFRQERPIISWEDPFGQYVDTSSVWGPTRGREFYAGLRFKLKG